MLCCRAILCIKRLRKVDVNILIGAVILLQLNRLFFVTATKSYIVGVTTTIQMIKMLSVDSEHAKFIELYYNIEC